MLIYHEAEAERLEKEADQEAQALGDGLIKRDWTLLVVLVLVVSILGLALLYFSIVGQRELPSQFFTEEMTAMERFELRGLFGDQWGAFTGIISGLSFAFVALSLFAQRSELKMSRRELSMQRVELKYARAQSHRQLHELRTQRVEQERRAIFQKEPIVMASSVHLVPVNKGAELRLVLGHFGPAACNLEFDAQFGDMECFTLNAPQILSEDSRLSHPLRSMDINQLRSVVSKKDTKLELKLCLKYRNLAGGCFICDQKFQISAFSLKSALMFTDDSPQKFTVVATTFRQAEITRLTDDVGVN